MNHVRLARIEAENLLEQLHIRTAPVDVEEIAEKLGLWIQRDDLGVEVSGLLVTKEGDSGIVVREDDATVRQRFTIAHEIGHFVLKHHRTHGKLVRADQNHQVMYRSQEGFRRFDPLEVQANQFAANLLMPVKLLEAAVQALKREICESDVTTLAKKFGVSEQAMTIRLTAMKHI
jgi:Zn-dependent peptidase ImmA (M78 family)